MAILIAYIGSILTLFVILFKNSQKDPVDIVLQLLIIMGIPIFFGIFFLIKMLQVYNRLEQFSTHPLNRYLFALLMFLLILLPINRFLLLDDLVFIALTIIIVWTWISWSCYFERQQK